MFTFIESQKLPVKPYCQPVKVPLNSSAALQNTNSSPCFGIIHKLDAGTFHPIVKDAKTVLVPMLIAPHCLSPSKLLTVLLNLYTNHSPLSWTVRMGTTLLVHYPVLILLFLDIWRM